MKRKNVVLLTLGIIGSLTLTSCDWLFGKKIEPVGEVTQFDGYYLPTQYSLNNQELNYSNFITTMNPIGNQKLLVVPVRFNDGPAWTQQMLEELDTAFFGDSSDTAWESVSSFYQKSSYGKLNLSGEVHNPVTISDMSISDGNVYKSNTSYGVAAAVYTYIIKPDKSKYLEYDTDKDGYLDSVVLVYSNTYDVNSDAYWAWVSWLALVTNISPLGTNLPNYGDCAINNFMWVSYEFMKEAYPGKIDTHTYIHETGHLLGLDDYYPGSGDRFNAAGGLDMMDYNILDHSVYSKLLMEWTYPYVIDGEKNDTVIKLKPFESSGECIIINDNWNGSPLDEYLAIEYYTPTGLNEKDGLTVYPGLANETPIIGYRVPGVKIYHVDARVAKLKETQTDLVFDSYINRIPEYDAYYYSIAASNNKDRAYTSDTSNTKLLHLMEATGVNSFKNGGRANDNTLFKTGDSFTPSNVFFKNGNAFNNNKKIGYKISIGEMTSEYVTIVISKI